MEAALPPLTFFAPRANSLAKLTERLAHNQVLLQDIKVHGPFVKSIVKQYDLQSSDKSSQNFSETKSTIKDSSKVCLPTPLDTASSLTTSCTTSTTHPVIVTPPSDLLREDDDSPLTSLDTITPRSEISEFPLTATSTPRNVAPSHSPQHTQHGASHSTKTRKAKFSVPKRARQLENRYHQVFLKALEWQCYLEQVIADCKEHGSTSGSDLDEPLSKCRRLSASSSESLHSTWSSLRPQSSTALSRNVSDSSASSREASPIRSISAISEFESLFSPNPEKPCPSLQAENPASDISSLCERVAVDEVDRSRPLHSLARSCRKRSSDSSRSRRSPSREDGRRSVRRRAESIASRRKPRRKKRRLANEFRSDEDRLRSTRCAQWQDGELNISETGSYIEDDYVCMSDGDEPCHASNSPVARLSTLKGRLTKNALPETQRNPVVLTQLQESDPKVTASPNLQGNLIPDSEAGQGI
ncbi:uncharacterized protein LOC108666690, partial [Hyalella azteca]|uniref:Uncharacterized protein LOC108666690 n=1 Tax=Hyalella azteca TaxID=294128 RepID=A0A8B7N740_HYAAZ